MDDFWLPRFLIIGESRNHDSECVEKRAWKKSVGSSARTAIGSSLTRPCLRSTIIKLK